MRRSVRLSDFARMSEPEKREAVAELVRAAREPPNGEFRAIELEVRAFERRFEMSSSDMRERVVTGRLPETEEICRWLMNLDVLDLVRAGARA